MQGFASLHASSLHIIPTEEQGLPQRRWMVWDEAAESEQTVHAALCDHSGRCGWHHVWHDAYQPTIRYMTRWSTEQTGVFLLTFHEGAEAETAVAIGLPRGKTPVIYDQRDGSWAVVTPDELTLEINTSSRTDLTPACLGWNAVGMRLEGTHCRWWPNRT